MLAEKQQQAKNLYFQTDLTKTQIADIINVSRRSLHYWIRENNWDRLKRSAIHLPAMLAENCYHIIARFSEQILSENRIMRPVTHQEADTLHKLALTIGKLKNHSTLNENMETFAYFMEAVHKKSPQLAEELTPIVNEYIEGRAKVDPRRFAPDKFNEQGYIPIPQHNTEETQKDIADIFAWESETDPTIVSLPNDPTVVVEPTSLSSGEDQAPVIVSPSNDLSSEFTLGNERSSRGEAPVIVSPPNDPKAPSPLERAGGEAYDPILEALIAPEKDWTEEDWVDRFETRLPRGATKEELQTYFKAEEERLARLELRGVI